VGEFHLQLFGWDGARRFVVVREQLQETKRSPGRKLLEVPGYTFRVFITNLAGPPEEIWRDYNQQACIEQRIEELKSDLAADDFSLKKFFATEAAWGGLEKRNALFDKLLHYEIPISRKLEMQPYASG